MILAQFFKQGVGHAQASGARAELYALLIGAVVIGTAREQQIVFVRQFDAQAYLLRAV